MAPRLSLPSSFLVRSGRTFAILFRARIARGLEEHGAQFINRFAGSGVLHLDGYLVKAVNRRARDRLLPAVDGESLAAFAIGHSFREEALCPKFFDLPGGDQGSGRLEFGLF